MRAFGRGPGRRASNTAYSHWGGNGDADDRGLIGWKLLGILAGVAWLVTAYQTFRLWKAPEQAAYSTAIATLVVGAFIFLQSFEGLS